MGRCASSRTFGAAKYSEVRSGIHAPAQRGIQAAPPARSAVQGSKVVGLRAVSGFSSTRCDTGPNSVITQLPTEISVQCQRCDALRGTCKPRGSPSLTLTFSEELTIQPNTQGVSIATL